MFNKAAGRVMGAGVLGLMLATGSTAAADNQSSQPPMAAPATPDSGDATASVANDDYVYNEDRTVRLIGSVTRESANKVIEKLLELSAEDPEADIELRIHSGGGSVTAGFAIYDVMRSLPNDIRTVCQGDAQSMAALLLSAGTPGKRYAYPHCRIMYHQPSWGVSGQITDIDVTGAEANAAKERMFRIIAEDSGWPEDFIEDMLERNFYPTTEEAQQMGFIDYIIEPSEDRPAAPERNVDDLPPGFCDSTGRQYMRICAP